MSSESLLATSPPGPPPPSLEEALPLSDVVVAEGVKIHWVVYDGTGFDQVPREVPGPTYSDGHVGSIILEAKVVKVIQYKIPFRKDKTIYIRLNSYQSRINELDQFIGKPLIYLIGGDIPWMAAAFPSGPKSQWHVELVDTNDARSTRTNALPIADLAKVEAIINNIRADKSN